MSYDARTIPAGCPPAFNLLVYQLFPALAGTTGESLSLTVGERTALLETWGDAAPLNGIRLIAHVGAESILDVLTLTRHAAAQLKVEALGMMPSVFFKPASVDALADWIETVAAAAPEKPLYYYHIPSQTGVLFDMLPLVSELDKRRVANFAGVKFTGLYETRAFADFQRCAAYGGGKYEIFSGREEMMVQVRARARLQCAAAVCGCQCAAASARLPVRGASAWR